MDHLQYAGRQFRLLAAGLNGGFSIFSSQTCSFFCRLTNEQRGAITDYLKVYKVRLRVYFLVQTTLYFRLFAKCAAVIQSQICVIAYTF